MTTEPHALLDTIERLVDEAWVGDLADGVALAGIRRHMHEYRRQERTMTTEPRTCRVQWTRDDWTDSRVHLALAPASVARLGDVDLACGRVVPDGFDVKYIQTDHHALTCTQCRKAAADD